MRFSGGDCGDYWRVRSCKLAEDMEAEKLVQGSDNESKWENMDENILLKIFMALNILDLAFNVSGVCQLWRKLSQESSFWGTVDMDEILGAYVEPNNQNCHSRDDVQKLEGILAYTRGSVTSLFCSTYSPFDVSNWLSIAERTPMLRNLALPVSESTRLSGFLEAVKGWPSLKTLTAAGVRQSRSLLKSISENCPQFSELKHMGQFDRKFACSIIEFLPNLTVLSLRGSFVHEDAIELILENLENLQVLNLSHCIIVKGTILVNDETSSRPIDWMRQMAARRLKQFMSCKSYCPKCFQAVTNFNGLSRERFDKNEKFWKEDELSCFTG